MVDLFSKIEEGVEFAEYANTPIPGGKVVNTAYLLILIIGETEKSCEQWEDMQVVQNNWKKFKYQLAQAYMHYQTRKKPTAAAHGYGDSENRSQ